jgi:TRAP-type uncharacterized transport system substrate-binding protein
MKVFWKILALFVGALVALAVFCASQDPTSFIGSGPTAGVYYPMGGGLADVLDQVSAQHQRKRRARPTARWPTCCLSIRARRMSALRLADAGWDAYKGQDKFQDKPINVRALMVLYPNRMHIVTVEGTASDPLWRI